MDITFATQIAFPGLGIKAFNLNPVAFEIFGKEIYWYGIIIATGLILAIFGLYRRQSAKM